VRTLALDPLTGDLALTAGRLTLVEGAEAVAQRLEGRLSLWLGSWFADLAVGVPFLDFLGQKNADALAEATLRRAILTCPGVTSLESFTFTVDRNARSATVTFRARTVAGRTVTTDDGGFRVGATNRLVVV
jgi:hypothetical protein